MTRSLTCMTINCWVSKEVHFYSGPLPNSHAGFRFPSESVMLYFLLKAFTLMEECCDIRRFLLWRILTQNETRRAWTRGAKACGRKAGYFFRHGQVKSKLPHSTKKGACLPFFLIPLKHACRLHDDLLCSPYPAVTFWMAVMFLICQQRHETRKPVPSGGPLPPRAFCFPPSDKLWKPSVHLTTTYIQWRDDRQKRGDMQRRDVAKIFTCLRFAAGEEDPSFAGYRQKHSWWMTLLMWNVERKWSMHESRYVSFLYHFCIIHFHTNIVYLCVFMYVFMHASCVRACMQCMRVYVCMCVCMYVRWCICVCLCMCVCVCVYVFMFVCMQACIMHVCNVRNVCM